MSFNHNYYEQRQKKFKLHVKKLYTKYLTFYLQVVAYIYSAYSEYYDEDAWLNNTEDDYSYNYEALPLGNYFD